MHTGKGVTTMLKICHTRFEQTTECVATPVVRVNTGRTDDAQRRIIGACHAEPDNLLPMGSDISDGGGASQCHPHFCQKRWEMLTAECQ
ncbi:hypothetical protein D3C71_1810070 [compost metagenome]